MRLTLFLENQFDFAGLAPVVGFSGRRGVLGFLDCLLGEVERFEVLVASALPAVDQLSHFAFLFILAPAVPVYEVVDRQITAANSNHDCLPLDLHEHALAEVSVNAWRLSLKMHLATQLKRLCVNKVRQRLINRIFLQRAIDEEVVFAFAL